MTWSNFIWFAIPAVLLWLTSGSVVYSKRCHRALSDVLMMCGIAVFATFIVGFWLHVERPPMRTMGETRLWYSLFLSTIGYLAFRRWRYSWILTFSSVVASVFVIVNLLKPEIYSKSLMPALQSGWFIPHVTSYIISYAMFGAATIGAIIMLWQRSVDRKIFNFIDDMIYVGYGFLTLGLLMGALWAKDAWGHYWSWDPKETWAFITATAYLAYIHLRLHGGTKYDKFALWLVPMAFALLMFTWLGVSILPSASSSVHLY